MGEGGVGGVTAYFAFSSPLMSSEVETSIGRALLEDVSTSLDMNGYGGSMAFWTYILCCADGRYYTGHTDDLEQRVGQHQSGMFKGFTSSRLPVRLMWSENFPTRTEAFEAEMRIKNWSQAKKEALFRGDWETIGYFAKPPHERPPRPAHVEHPPLTAHVERSRDIRRGSATQMDVSTSLDMSGIGDKDHPA